MTGLWIPNRGCNDQTDHKAHSFFQQMSAREFPGECKLSYIHLQDYECVDVYSLYAFIP